MNKYLKNYLAYKYNKMDTVSLEQQIEKVRFDLEKQKNKSEYLDVKSDALAEKLDHTFFANDKQLDEYQSKKAVRKTILSTLIPGIVVGGTIGATVVANSQGMPAEDVEMGVRTFFGIYGAGIGSMAAAVFTAGLSEDIHRLGSAISVATKTNICQSKIEKLEEKNKMIESELKSRFNIDEVESEVEEAYTETETTNDKEIEM